jgi:hypothetical protein
MRCLAPIQRDGNTHLHLLGELGTKKLTYDEFFSLTHATYLFETHLTPDQLFCQHFLKLLIYFVHVFWTITKLFAFVSYVTSNKQALVVQLFVLNRK